MIVCVCRNIKESDFDTKEQLVERLLQTDVDCGQCTQYVSQYKDHTIDLEVAEAT